MATISLLLSDEGLGKNKFISFDLNLSASSKMNSSFKAFSVETLSPIEDKFAVMKMIDDILVLGCPSCNRGQGSIILYDVSNNNNHQEEKGN